MYKVVANVYTSVSTTIDLPVAGTESAGKLGKFLVLAQFQGSVHSSALFLTAAAQNLLCLKLATEMGVVISSPWVTWVKGALAPALVGMLVTPFLIYSPCLLTRFPGAQHD